MRAKKRKYAEDYVNNERRDESGRRSCQAEVKKG
jgi:hypothetical protein